MENYEGEIKSVKLDLKVCTVSFVSEEGEGLKGVEYTGDKKLTPEISFENGILAITQPEVSGISYAITPFNKPKLTVTIGKESVLNNLDIRINTGLINMSGITADWFAGVVDAGNIEIKDSNFLKAEISARSGNIVVGNTNLDMVVIDANVGNVRLDAIEDLEQYSIDCRVGTGMVRVEKSNSAKEYSSKGKDTGYIKIKVNVGNIEIN